MAAHNFKDLTGQTFGKLTVINRAPNKGKSRVAYWNCICQCDENTTTECIVSGERLRNGETRSCGCLRNKDKIIHGESKSRLHNIWCDIYKRCYDPNSHAYHNYGGRTEGDPIEMRSGWKDEYIPFRDYVLSIGYEDHVKAHGELNTTLDRIDVNGHYEVGNVKWSTKAEQARNMRTNINIEINGETKCLSEWCRIYNIKLHTAYMRIKRGWTQIDALTIPVGSKSK